MPLVNLGVQRDPSELGTAGLLRQAIGGEQGYEMVEFDFYTDRLEGLQSILQQRSGDCCWVIGDRGTGKSEVLAHLFRKSIQNNPENARFPIYISVTDAEARESVPGGVEEGYVSMGLFNWLCARSLLEAFQFLKKLPSDSPYYPKLRKMLERDYDPLEEYLKSKDFSLREFLIKIQAKPQTSNALLPAIVFDDMDKISTASAMQFFSENQTDLANIVGTLNTTIITSVTKGFITEGRENQGLDWCLNRALIVNDPKELMVPDLSELSAADVQEFINQRISYLHWTGAQWEFSPNEVPHTDVMVVLDDANWKSFDPTKMRRNGTLLALNAWLTRSSQVNIRQVIRNLDAVLDDCDTPGRELNAAILQEVLRRNDGDDTHAINTELEKRLFGSEVTSDRLQEEVEMLEIIKHDQEIWSDLRDLVNDRIGLGSWTKNATMKRLATKNHKGVGNVRKWLSNLTMVFRPSSGVTQALELVVEIGSSPDHDGFPPKISSRTPDELLAKITPKLLILAFEEAIVKRETHKLEEEESHAVNQPPVHQNGKGAEPDISESDSVVVDAYDLAFIDWGDEWRGVIGEFDPAETSYWGREIALNLVRVIIGTGSWGPASRKIRTNFKKEPLDSMRLLQQWFAHHVREDDESQIEVLRALHDVVMGNDLQALLKHVDAFEEILEQDFISQGRRRLEARRDVILKPPDGFDIRWDFDQSKEQALQEVMTRFKLQVNEDFCIVVSHTRGEEGFEPVDYAEDVSTITEWLDGVDSILNEPFEGSDDELLNRLVNAAESRETILDEIEVIFGCTQGELLSAMFSKRSKWVDVGDVSKGEEIGQFRLLGIVHRQHQSIGVVTFTCHDSYDDIQSRSSFIIDNTYGDDGDT